METSVTIGLIIVSIFGGLLMFVVLYLKIRKRRMTSNFQNVRSSEVVQQTMYSRTSALPRSSTSIFLPVQETYQTTRTMAASRAYPMSAFGTTRQGTGGPNSHEQRKITSPAEVIPVYQNSERSESMTTVIADLGIRVPPESSQYQMRMTQASDNMTVQARLMLEDTMQYFGDTISVQRTSLEAIPAVSNDRTADLENFTMTSSLNNILSSSVEEEKVSSLQ